MSNAGFATTVLHILRQLAFHYNLDVSFDVHKISVSEKGVIKQLPHKTNKFILFCWYVDSLAV